jgi:glycosidase
MMLATLLLTLRGTPFIYQGQEIGMKHVDFRRLEEIRDIEAINGFEMLKRWRIPKAIRKKLVLRNTRDQVRTPVQWDDSRFAGFSTVLPWLEDPRRDPSIHVKQQEDDPTSILSYYKRLIALRNRDVVLQDGTYQTLHIGRYVYAFQRTLEEEVYIILVNFSKKRQSVSYKGDVMIGNYDRTEFDGLLEPYEAVVLRR